MADRKVTVLNPAGYQEQLPDTDNIVLALAPTANNHGANKAYVDSGDSNLQGQIDQITGGSLDGKYVERAGDDMTGNLTFNTNNIILSSAGDGTFVGDVTANAFIGDGSQLTNLPLQPTPNLQEVTDVGSSTTKDIVLKQTALTTNLSLYSEGRVAVKGPNDAAKHLFTGTTDSVSGYTFYVKTDGTTYIKGDTEIGSFNTQGIKLVKDGYIDCNRQAANHSIYRGKLNGTVKIDIHANGDVDSDGTITANQLVGDIDAGEY